MKSSTKKSRKRSLSPSTEEASKRSRGDNVETRVLDSNVYTRPTTRSTKGSLVVPTPTPPHRKKTESKSSRKKVVATPINIDIDTFPSSGQRSQPPPSEKKLPSVSRKRPTKKSELPHTPVDINIAHNRESLTNISDRIIAKEGATSCVTETEESPCNESFDKTLILFTGFSRALVVLTIVLFFVASLIRIDHDKHDTHGIIRRSGRKMYSYLTLGFIQPWEWGVPRRDVVLLRNAESILLRQQDAISSLSNIDISGTELFVAIANVEQIAKSFHNSVLENPYEMLTRDVLTFHHKEVDYEKFQKSLLKANGHSREKLVKCRDVEPSIENVLHEVRRKIIATRESICTIRICRRWSDAHAEMNLVSDHIQTSADRDFLSEVHAKIRDNLTNTAAVHFTSRVAHHVFNDAVAFLEPKYIFPFDDYALLIDCMRNILTYTLDDVVTSFWSNYISFGNADMGNVLEEFRGTQLETKIHNFLSSMDNGRGGKYYQSVEKSEVSAICVSLFRILLSVHKINANELISDRINGPRNPTRNRGVGYTSSTDLIDYAIAPRGGRVVSALKPSMYMLTSPPYIPTFFHSVGLMGGYGEASVVTSTSKPAALGDCYAFEGSTGNITILLSAPYIIKEIGIFQLKEIAEESAVRSFRVFGWSDLPLATSEGDPPNAPFVLGSYSVDFLSHSPNSFQRFQLAKDRRVHALTFNFESNSGNSEFTCVYRIQVLGMSH